MDLYEKDTSSGRDMRVPMNCPSLDGAIAMVSNHQCWRAQSKVLAMERSDPPPQPPRRLSMGGAPVPSRARSREGKISSA